MFDDVRRFIIVDTLFDRYTIIVDIGARTTNVYCEECDMWVVEYDGEQVSRNTHTELLQSITEIHRTQVIGYPVEIADMSKDLSNWRDK